MSGRSSRSGSGTPSRRSRPWRRFPATERSCGAPDKHPALFSDHGVVHARDVAAGTLELADVVDGRLLPARPADRREFVTALAVLIAYIHDVGMNDPTREGRRAHAIYAAQMPFSGAMDDVLARLWESGGPVVSRICSVGALDPFRVPDDVVLRELASLALAHSKSMVPATLHADFSRFRRVLQQAVLVEFEEHRRAGARLNPDDDLPDALGANGRWYADPVADAFAWVDSPHPAHRRSRPMPSTPCDWFAWRTRCASVARRCERPPGTRSSSTSRRVRPSSRSAPRPATGCFFSASTAR